MQLNDLHIGTQLRLGLGLIFAIVVLFAVLVWLQTDMLWRQAKDLYEHPLQVRSAVGSLETDVLAMRGGMKSVSLADNEQDIATALAEIHLREVDVSRQFTILRDRYLGSQHDVQKLQDQFAIWKAFHEETLRLIRDGRKKEAFDRLKNDGIGGNPTASLMDQLGKVDNFARNKSNELRALADAQHLQLTRKLAFMVCGILVLSLIIFWTLLKGIRGPLGELTMAADQFRQGRLNSRSPYTSANEFGTLSAAFNTLADTVQKEIEGKSSAAHLAEVMLAEKELQGFCRELLKALLAATGSNVGAVYLLDASQMTFKHFDSIGLAEEGQHSFSATAFTGEFGAVLASKQIQHITNIPADTCFSLRLVIGDCAPRAILTIPVLSGSKVSAVVSLAAVDAYDEPALGLVRDIWSVLNARMNEILALREIQSLAITLDHQNRELDVQKSALEAQTHELIAQNHELERQKGQLALANRQKSTFLSNMSHELRTPLNSVIVLSSLLSRRLVENIPAEEYGYLEIIERNGKTLLTLINDILDLSRIEAGFVQLNISSFSVHNLVSEIVAMLEPLAREKGIELHNQVQSSLPQITSDIDKCRHILQNLVANGLKFTEQGQVAVSARQEDSALLISVVDTGIGIPEDHLATIFEEFSQGDDSTSRKYGGTGLGLAIAKKYALLLDGAITVLSTPGQGTTFCLRLPLTLQLPKASKVESESLGAEMPGQVQSPLPQESPSFFPWQLDPPPRSTKPLILVVEDNSDALLTIKALLQDTYQIIEATDGRAGIEQARRHLPDLILTDIAMPVMEGFQALEEIRRDQYLQNIPVIAVTSSAMRGDRETILARGFDGYVSKPIDPRLLAKTMQEILEQRSEPMNYNQDGSDV